MTIEQAWGLYKVLTAPTPKAIKVARRVWSDARDTAGIINEILPPAVSSSGAPNGKEGDPPPEGRGRGPAARRKARLRGPRTGHSRSIPPTTRDSPGRAPGRTSLPKGRDP